MAKKTAFTLAALLTAALVSAPLMAAKPDNAGENGANKGNKIDGVVQLPSTKKSPDRDVVNTGGSDSETPGPSPS